MGMGLTARVLPTHLGEAGEVGVRGHHGQPVLDRERGELGVGDEVASVMLVCACNDASTAPVPCGGAGHGSPKIAWPPTRRQRTAGCSTPSTVTVAHSQVARPSGAAKLHV